MKKPITIAALLLAAALSGGCGGSDASTGPPVAGAPRSAPMAFDTPPAAGTRARCPVAGRDFVVPKEASRVTHAGKHYVLCCDGCKAPFEANPQKYVGKQQQP